MALFDDSRDWFVSRNGVQKGPIAGDKLRALAQAGRLEAATDFLWCEGMPQWLAASEFDGLFTPAPVQGAFAAPANPSASPPTQAAGAVSLMQPKRSAYAEAKAAQASAPTGNDVYAPPDSDYLEGAADGVNDDFLDNARRVPVGNVVAWFTASWHLFKSQPWHWIGVSLGVGVAITLTSLVPVVGRFLSMFSVFFFTGGVMYACQNLEYDGGFEFADITEGCREHLGALAGLVGLYVSGVVVIAATMAVVLPKFISGDDGVGYLMLMQSGFAVVLMFGMAALIFAYLTALTLAVPLIILNDVPVISAVILSIKGLGVNIIPVVLSAVAIWVLMVVATLPVMLGWLVLGPLLMIFPYAVYRDIFYAPQTA